MNKKTTKKRRRISKAQRKRQQMATLGGMGLLILVLVIALAVFVLESCGTDYTKADTNTVYVLKNGKVISADVENFDVKTYSKDKMESYINEIVDTYNEGKDRGSLKQRALKVEKNIATLVLEYADTKVYEDVNGVELFSGTIKDASAAGYTFAVEFAQIKDGKAYAATVADFAKDESYKVVIIKSNTKVVVPGAICFVSTEHTAKVGKDYVSIKDGAKLLTEQEINTEFGSDTQGSDGAIGEDELVSGDGNMIFDFGDEPDTGSSQYSEVLTYIIYR